MSNLLKVYRTKIVPELQKQLHLKNVMAVPRLTKVVVNTGIGRLVGQTKDEKTLEQIQNDLALITGQKPVPTLARKAIASFKTRVGQVIGYKVTLRGKRMYDFVERLIKIALPRTRDFRGLDPKAVSGNSLTIGVKEHIVFPEVSTEHVKNIFGFEVTVVSDARNREQALALFKALGFPFKKG